MNLTINPLKKFNKVINVPGDKSISHRSVMFGALSEGTTHIKNFLMSEDCLSTISCFRKMGVKIDIKEDLVEVQGVGVNGLTAPTEDLYVGNSGTTIRLMLGILAAQNFNCKVYGDDSIGKRPMDRVLIPLKQMGGNFSATNDKFTPIDVLASKGLNSIHYESPIASAQVKSSVILAGLYANGTTSFIEPAKSRDHTERMLGKFGVKVLVDGLKVSIQGKQKLKASDITVPSDISSAAFFLVLGAITPDSEITIKDVGLNPTRKGIVDILKEMGANITIENLKDENFEPIADLKISTSKLKGITVGGEIIPKLIDEIPIIAVAACFAEGTTIIKDAEELKVKESNRIKAMCENLKAMGANIEETPDGMIIHGGNSLNGSSNLKSFNDHRIAMSMTIAALNATSPSEIDSIDCANISFPNFFNLLDLM